jgi:D-psicose/D-tagatose/L-ribulose 3-epimerase
MLAALEKALPHLAYFEIDQNDRGMPDRGTIDFGPMLAKLKAADYQGLIGIEAFSSAISGPDVTAGVAAWRNLFESGDDVAVAGREIIRRGGW